MKMDKARYYFGSVGIENIDVYPGQYIQVRLARRADGTNAVVLELRVTENGKPEIFCDEPELVKTFKEWYESKEGK